MSTNINALISLLDDQDEFIVNSVHQELMQKNQDVIPILIQAQSLIKNSRTRQLISEAIDSIELKELKKEIYLWKSSDNQELDWLSYIIGKTTYRKLDRVEHNEMFQKEIYSLSKKINPSLTLLEKISVFNDHFYNTLKYSLNNSNQILPQNNYPHKVLLLKKATPLSLSYLYTLFAQKLNIPLTPLEIKGFFLLGYNDNSFSSKNISSFPFHLVINPLNHGSVISKKEFEFFIESHTTNSQYTDIKSGNIVLVNRLLHTLYNSYVNLGEYDEASRIKNLYQAFKSDIN